MKLVTTTEMRTLEQAAVDSGATWPGLMEQAGWGVAQQALRLLGNPAGRRVLALVGPGNNGGDGLVAARHLHDTGAQVALYLWRRRESDDDANWRRCRERGLPEHEASADPRRAQLRRLLADCDLVIDALLGMGISRPVEGELAEIVRTLNDEPRTKKSEFSVQRSAFSVLSVDMPTGVDSDSGAVRGAAPTRAGQSARHSAASMVSFNPTFITQASSLARNHPCRTVDGRSYLIQSAVPAATRRLFPERCASRDPTA